jgi:diguanylate cyclase (GGDEF)-like protein
MNSPPDFEDATPDTSPTEAKTSVGYAPARSNEIGLPLAYQRHGTMDAANRMRTGLIAYPTLWIVLMPVNDFAESHPWLAWGNAVGLVLFSLFRLYFNECWLPGMLDRDLVKARHAFRITSVIYNLYWGILCAKIMVSGDAGDLRWLMMMSTVGITASGTVNISLDRVLPRFHSPCTLGPTVVAVLPLGGAVNYAIVGLFMVLVIYSMGISRLVSREYWGRLHNQYLLEEHARELEKLSRTDALTQVANRLRFQEALANAWRDARRRQEPLSVAIIDLDHFKRINDTYGHVFGDRCLQAAAQALADAIRRPYDLVARYGGEEFAVLLPNTSLENAEALAERLLQGVRALSLEYGDEVVRLSCSIGVATCTPGRMWQTDQLVRLADDALYSAKQSGRARVVAHRGGPPEDAVNEAAPEAAQRKTASSPVAGHPFESAHAMDGAAADHAAG